MSDFTMPKFPQLPQFDGSGVYTTDEIRTLVIRQLHGLIDYWLGLPGKTERERLEGVIFSTLALLDGSALLFPGFIVAPCPPKEDQPWLAEQGLRWFPENDPDAVQGDIGGSLHEFFAAYKHD